MTLNLRGGTALITGASSGLGMEFARRFAEAGSNLVLVARRRERMEELATELHARNGVAVEVIAADLSVPTAAEELKTELDRRGIAVTSLINNAGFGSHGGFAQIDPQRLNQEVQLNVGTLVAMTRAFSEQLLEGSGVLINIASTAAYQPTPGMAVYGATKAFVLSFTEALWAEARGSNLRVLAVSPGSTKTEFFDVVGTTEASVGRQQTAEQVVDAAMKEIGHKQNRPSIVSGFNNHLTTLSGRLLTRKALVQMTGRVMGDVRIGA